MNRRRFLTAVSVGSASAFLSGCTGRELEDDSSITLTQSEFLDALDPHGHVNTTDGIILGQAYENLLDRTEDGEIVARLGTDWERIESGRFRVGIRENVTFHNGDDLTPEDVAFSINRIVDEDTDITSPQASTYAPIAGAEVVDGERAVDVLSDGHNHIIEEQLASYFGQIVNRSWIEERSSEEINQEINGTGPLRLEEYEEDVQLTYVPNEDYWGDAVEFSEFTFNAASESSTRVNELITDSSNLVTNVPPHDIGRIESEGDERVEATQSTRVVFAAMRHDTEPFSSEEFRRAMNYAIDLESIVDSIVDGYATPMGQPTIESAFGHSDDVEPYPYDPDEAEALVEESGFTGADITLETPVGSYLQDSEIAEAVASYIDDLPNVACSIEQRDFNNLVDEVANGDISTSPDFYLLGWGNEMFDASIAIEPVLTSGGQSTSYEDEEVDELMARAQEEDDEDEREALLREANELLHERAPWVYLIQEDSIYGIDESIEWEPRTDDFIATHEMAKQ